MRVAFFIPDLRCGGAERVAVNLSTYFVEKGFEVDVVLAKAEGPLVGSLHQKARVVDLRSQAVSRSTIALAKYLKERRPGFLVSHLVHANIFAAIAVCLAGSRTRHITVTHQVLSQNLLRSPLVKSLLVRIGIRILYPGAFRIVAVSQAAADDLAHEIGVPPSRIRVLPNAVITDQLLTLSKETPIHDWFQRGGIPVVLAVGSLRPLKDHLTLIRAFSIARRTKEMRLVILGEGPERPMLTFEIEQLGLTKDVELPGVVENPYPYMARCAVFVSSSRSEAQPTVLIEALSLSRSIVSTDTSGARDILGEASFGRLVPIGDTIAMGQALVDACVLDPTPVDKSKLSKYTVQNAGQQYLDLMGIKVQEETESTPAK